MSQSTGMRLSALAIVAVSLIGALTARLWFLTAVEGEAAVEAAAANRIRTLHIQAPRGRILDRNQLVLVDNRSVRQVRIDSRALDEAVVFEEDARNEVYARLAELLNVDRLVPEFGVRVDIPVDPRVIGRAARDAAEADGSSTQQAAAAGDAAEAAAEAQPEATDWTTELIAAALEVNFVGPFVPTPVVDDVPESLEIALAERQMEFPGIDVERIAVRSYPHGSLAAHALGYVGPISGPEEIEEVQNGDKPYELTDDVGRAGVEATYEDWLRGTPGTRVIEVDAEGDIVRQVSYDAPVPGMDVVLTLDIQVQTLLERQLTGAADTNDAAGASGIVEDPRTGAIIAMASVPTYDPSAFINGIGQEEFDALSDEEAGNALLNRAIAGEYAPGSTFKIVTGLAGLRAGLVTPQTSFYDDGTYEVAGCPESDPSCAFNNAGEIPNGQVNLQRSLTISSDWYYYWIGDNLWGNRDRLGDDYLQQTAQDYGFVAETGVDLPGEREGFAFTPEIVAELHEENPEAFPYGDWTSGNTINMAIGQGDLGVTPIQLTNAYAAIANGGTLYRPHLGQAMLEPRPAIDRWMTDEETSCRETSGDNAGSLRTDGVLCSVTPVQLGAVEIADQWRDPTLAGLLGVSSGDGTAAGAYEGFPLSEFPIAGKTGTAQVAGKGDFALYVGFGPVRPGQSPEYVVSVILEDVAQFGGEVAAPVARAVFDGLRDPMLLPPVPSATEARPTPTTDAGGAGDAPTTTTVP